MVGFVNFLNFFLNTTISPMKITCKTSETKKKTNTTHTQNTLYLVYSNLNFKYTNSW